MIQRRKKGHWTKGRTQKDPRIYGHLVHDRGDNADQWWTESKWTAEFLLIINKQREGKILPFRGISCRRNEEIVNDHLATITEKAEEPETKLPTSIGSSKQQESSRKTSTSALLTTPKPLTVWITINCGKF